MKSEDTTATYRYNAQGYRTEKTVNGATTRYLYEGDKVVLETDKTNNQKAFQVYGTNLLYRAVAKSDGMEAEEYYYLYNAHGDVTGLIDAKGNIAATYYYDAFGTILSETGSANNNIKYAGYQHDKETGLYYLNARYYDSTIARFITEDTYRGQKNDPLSLNLYTYCHNSSIMYTDPSGHSIKKGDSGKEVAAIQRTLKAKGYYTGPIDGKFGPKTNTAVKAFQADNNLKKDGIVGPKTTAALYGAKTDTMTTAPNKTGTGSTGGSTQGSSGGSNKATVTPTPAPKSDKKNTNKVIAAASLVGDNVVYYSQTDPKWSSTIYSSTNDKKQTIGSSGCGPTSMAMVITSLTDYTVTPKDMASFSVKNGYRTKNSGTRWGFFGAVAEEYDLEVIQTDDVNKVKNALNDGECMVIASMGKGHFTQGGHYVVLSGVSEVNGTIMFTVLDPNDNNGNWGNDGKIIRTYSTGIVLADANMVNQEHKEYFIVKKKK